MASSRAGKGFVAFSSGTQGSSESGRYNARKGDRSRRSWTTREEEILLASMKELVSQGWKSDNGFRSGYLNKVEEALRREFPSTDLKINPNIISKITNWKKNYYSLVGILNRSGVGFNSHGDYMVDCGDEQWEQIVKVDPNARFIRNKSWPYWDDWKVIFGKDRANGSNAEDILEAVNDLYSHDKTRYTEVGGDYNVNLEDLPAEDGIDAIGVNEGADQSSFEVEKTSQQPKQSGRKCKSTTDGLDGIVELLSRMHEDSQSRLQMLSSRIGWEYDLSKSRKEVFELLGRIPGLSLDEKFDVCEILGKETDRLDLFMGLPDAARHAYVLRVLREKHKN